MRSSNRRTRSSGTRPKTACTLSKRSWWPPWRTEPRGYGRDRRTLQRLQAKEGGMAEASSGVRWYGLSAEEAAEQLQVDVTRGLSSAEVKQRQEKYGPNKLA